MKRVIQTDRQTDREMRDEEKEREVKSFLKYFLTGIRFFVGRHEDCQHLVQVVVQVSIEEKPEKVVAF